MATTQPYDHHPAIPTSQERGPPFGYFHEVADNVAFLIGMLGFER